MTRIEQYNALEGYVSANKSNSGGGKQQSSLVKPFCVKKGLVTAILVISLLAMVAAVASAANIIYVGPGEIETTIQGAVNNATEGDTIIVRDGIYTENIDVTKSVTIRSENGPATCTVEALDSEDYVFHVTADYTNITGFTITGANTESSRAGIYLGRANHCDISGNTISSNGHGIYLYFSSNNTISGNTASKNDYGIHLYRANTNTISSNTVTSNSNYGIYLSGSNDNTIYNNYFNNTNNVRDNGNNVWNITKTEETNIIGGEYRGGNYWSDYAGEDLDGDGLGNTLLPYNTSGDIEDGYIGDGGDWLPLVFGDPETTPPALEVTVDIEPDTFNLKSKGKWITAYIELQDGDVNAINVTTLMLNDQVQAEDHPSEIGDYDGDGIADLMVKFNRPAVQGILEVGEEVAITVTGELTDGTPFEGSDTIRVIDKGGKKSNSDSGEGGKNSDNDNGKGGKK